MLPIKILLIISYIKRALYMNAKSIKKEINNNLYKNNFIKCA